MCLQSTTSTIGTLVQIVSSKKFLQSVSNETYEVSRGLIREDVSEEWMQRTSFRVFVKLKDVKMAIRYDRWMDA